MKVSKWIKRILKSDYMNVYFFDMVTKGMAMLIAILLIRYLSQENYAQYTLFNSVGSFISGILGSGLSLAYTRYAVMLREKGAGLDGCLYRELRGKIIVLSFVILLGCSLLFAFKKITLVMVFGIVYGLFLSLYQINTVFFQAREMYSRGGIVSNIKNFSVTLVLIICFLVIKNTQLLVVLSTYMVGIIVAWCITTSLINRVLSEEKRRFRYSSSSFFFKEMVKDSIWIILYMFTISAFNQLDVMLLTFFCDLHEVAIYGVANRYYTIVISLLPALQVVLRVKNSGSEISKSKVMRKKVVRDWVKKATPFAVLLFIVGSIGARLFFPILNGKEYNGAILVFNILLIGASLSYITAPNVSVMITAGKQKILFLLSVGSFLINLVGNILLIPAYGANAAALTTILAHLFLNGGSTVIMLLEKSE